MFLVSPKDTDHGFLKKRTLVGVYEIIPIYICRGTYVHLECAPTILDVAIVWKKCNPVAEGAPPARKTAVKYCQHLRVSINRVSISWVHSQ